MTVEVLQFPAGIYPDVQRLTPDVGNGQSVSESQFSGVQNVTTFRGAERWKLEMSFANLTGANRAVLSAFVARLRVSHNVFICVNHTAPQRGLLTGTPLAVASLNGHYLNVTNLVASQTGWALAGDFCSVNSNLHMIVEDVGTDASGVASLHVWPPLFGVPGSGDIVKVSSPCGAFRMAGVSVLNTQPPGYVTDMTITAVSRVNSSMVSAYL